MRFALLTVVLTVLGISYAGLQAVAEPLGCADPVIYKVTASAYPEANQTVVAQIRSNKDCSFSNAAIQNADDPEKYDWEAYRLKSDLKSGQQPQSEYIGRAFLMDKNHIVIRLNQDKTFYASDSKFFSHDKQQRVILVFSAKGLKNLMQDDFAVIFGKSGESNEEWARKVKFIGVPVHTGIQRFDDKAEK